MSEHPTRAVIIVEDDEMIRGLLEQAIQPHLLPNTRLITFSNGNNLDPVPTENLFVFSDFEMPGADGGQVIENLMHRAKGVCQFVLASGKSPEANPALAEAITRITALGVTPFTFLQKPNIALAVVRLVQDWLRRLPS